MNERSKLTGATHALRLPSRVASMETHCGYPIELLSEADSIALHNGAVTCSECARVAAERARCAVGELHTSQEEVNGA